MTTTIHVLHVLALLLLSASAGLALYRMARGPTSLDRSIASDVVIAVLIAGVGLYTIHYQDSFGLPILVVLSLVGFTAAVGMARLISNRSDQIRSMYESQHRDASPSEGGFDAWEEDGRGDS